MASTTCTTTTMGMAQARARGYVHADVVPIAGFIGSPSWTFQSKNDHRWPEDPGGSAG